MVSLIPISDANPTRRFPIVTIALIALNVIAFLQEPGWGQNLAGARYFVDNAPIPCQLEDACASHVQLAPGASAGIPDRDFFSFLFAIVFSTFLHAGILHIVGNLLFLWVFGNNVEDFLGRIKFIVFYLLGGIVAGFAHILFNLDSNLPIVGASGAVAAIMGAYLVLYPRARVNVLVPFFFFFTVVQMSAFAVLGLWFLYQFLIGLQEFAGAINAVAWLAHVGGFLFGVAGIYLLGGRPHRPHQVWEPEWHRY